MKRLISTHLAHDNLVRLMCTALRFGKPAKLVLSQVFTLNAREQFFTRDKR